MKISREGIVLIKSFEGFRPRAILREQGGWVIGYGHTLSAREGASVSEADAELLLRYDLLPVEKTVNHAGSAVLNQHQFDALVSFAFSVGIDRFQTSDVLEHLTTGATGQAADALMGWPEPALPQAALRRRAAERALFVADPDAPVAVSDLLVAPLAASDAVPLGDVDATLSPEPEPVPVPVPVPEPIVAAMIDATDAPSDDAASANPRNAAVSALLGEVDDVHLPSFAPPPSIGTDPPADDSLPPAANDTVADDMDVSVTSSIGERSADSAPQPTDQTTVAPSGPVANAPDEASGPTQAQQPVGASNAWPANSVDHVAMTVQRYTPYGAAMVGPLPFLQPARERIVQTEVLVPSPIHETIEAPAEVAGLTEIVSGTDAPIAPSFVTPADAEPLVLSPTDDAPEPAMIRQPWTIEERSDPVETTDGGLFGEDLSLTQGGAPVMRHGDIEFEAPARFDWSETGAFIIMGAVGLTAFGAAMAAFRLASEQSGGDETTIIAWVLAVIGAGCVGVSSFNLYRRWGLPGGDN